MVVRHQSRRRNRLPRHLLRHRRRLRRPKSQHRQLYRRAIRRHQQVTASAAGAGTARAVRSGEEDFIQVDTSSGS